MRKLTAILLSIIILLGNSGIVLAIHHCHIAEVTSFSLMQDEEDACHDDQSEDAATIAEVGDNCCTPEKVEAQSLTDESCDFRSDFRSDFDSNSQRDLSLEGATGKTCCEQKDLNLDADFDDATILLKELSHILATQQYIPLEIGESYSSIISTYSLAHSPPAAAKYNSYSSFFPENGLAIRSIRPLLSTCLPLGDNDEDAPQV